MYQKTTELPKIIQDALYSIGYRKPDVKIDVTESVSIHSSGSQGYRSFALILNLSTNEQKKFYGSWGGANAFNTSNQVDLDDTEHQIPADGLVIKGFESVGPVHATIYVSSKNVSLQLPETKDELSQDEKQVLYVLQAYKAFARKDYLTGRFAEDKRQGFRVMSDLDLSSAYQSLNKKGFIKINKAGSISITTEGKNA